MKMLIEVEEIEDGKWCWSADIISNKNEGGYITSWRHDYPSRTSAITAARRLGRKLGLTPQMSKD